jgi:DNA/RNA-binding domain of Phe-tRNA-synthetase-like protein
MLQALGNLLRKRKEGNSMTKIDTAIDPKPIVSFMFAVSVGFWASQLATYIKPVSDSDHLCLEAQEMQSETNN